MENRDLLSVGKYASQTHLNTKDDFSEYLEIWKSEANIASANDLLDAHILTGDVPILNKVIEIVEYNMDYVSPRFQDSIQLALRAKPDPLKMRRMLAFKERDESYVQYSISILKKILKEYPRDALSYFEIARLYAVLGQFDHVEKCLLLARWLAPDNRLILRATLQFYDTVSCLDEGLNIVRESELLSYDPWIQSAEIATSTILGKTSRVANKKLLKFDKDGFISYNTSELAMALATLDKQSGVKERKIFQLVTQALPNSTENGFSQAVWLSDNSSRDFTRRFPEAIPSEEAFEARLQIALEQQDLETAKGFAELWLEDQPFNVDVILHYFNLGSVHFAPDDEVIKAAIRYSSHYSENWQILNSCVITMAEGGLVDAAARLLPKLEKFAPQDFNKAFVEAARGLVAFARGEFSAGRNYYEAAGKIASRGKRSDLVLNSMIFWIRCEVRNGLISEAYLKEILQIVDKSISKIDVHHRTYLQNVWKSTLRMLDSYKSQANDDGEILRRLSIQAADQGDLYPV